MPPSAPDDRSAAPRLLVTLKPEAGERELIDDVLGDQAVWLVDDPSQEALQAVDTVLCFWPREELRRGGIDWTDLPGLRFIQVATAGVNHIGWSTVPDGVQVANAPGSSADAVGEYVLAAVLQWARGFQRLTRAIREGGWPLGAPVKALAELRIGLVGFGGIGQATAHRLGRDGATVRAVSRSGRADPDAERLVERLEPMDALGDLAAWADVLVVCLPLVRSTLGLIDDGVLRRMADRDALLVNVARGPVVDQDALYDWLAAEPERRSAVLDVWWRYPKSPDERPFDRPFDRLPNVVMTPHDAPNVTGFRQAMIAQATEQLQAYLRTGEARHVQDPEAHRLDVEGDGR